MADRSNIFEQNYREYCAQLSGIDLSLILELWDVKQKPRPHANAPPIDVFPAYDQSLAPTDDQF